MIVKKKTKPVGGSATQADNRNVLPAKGQERWDEYVFGEKHSYAKIQENLNEKNADADYADATDIKRLKLARIICGNLNADKYLRNPCNPRLVGSKRSGGSFCCGNKKTGNTGIHPAFPAQIYSNS